MKIRGFVPFDDKEVFYMPKRSTKGSMAYDFLAPSSLTIKPGEIGEVYTNVKSYMLEDEGLIINVRSSMGGKVMISHTQGWVDSDYTGNIRVCLLNISKEDYVINKGDKIAQGMFIKVLSADGGNSTTERTGGFGSTGK